MFNGWKIDPFLKTKIALLLLVEGVLWLVTWGLVEWLTYTHPKGFLLRYPEFLWLQLLVLPYYFFQLKAASGFQRKVGKMTKINRSSFLIQEPTSHNPIKWILTRVAFACIVFAMVQPLYGVRKTRVQARTTEIVLALDISNSMNTRDIESNSTRLDIAKRATVQLINELKGERIGIVLFAGEAFVQLPITKDYEAAKMFVNEIETKMISSQGTNFESALIRGKSMFSKTEDTKCILMITDGENHTELPEELLIELPKESIYLAMVGLGTRNGGLIPQDLDRPELGYKIDEMGKSIVSKMDAKLVRTMAQKAKGIAVIVDSPFPNLSDLLTEINRLNNGKLRDLNLEIKQNHYGWPLLLGILVLCVAQMIPFSWKLPKKKMNINKNTFLLILFAALNLSVFGQNAEPKNREDWRGWLNAARQAYQGKEYEKALQCYANASLSAPKNIDLRDELAQTHYRLNQLEKSKEIYSKTQKTDAAAKARIEYNQGTIALKEKNYQEAIERYKSALKNNPTDDQARYNLSEAMRKMAKENQEKKQNPEQPKSNKPQANPNQPKKNSPPKDSENQANDSPSGLSDKTIERMLNKLMKQEAQTKRKIASGQEGGSEYPSRKDW